MTMVYTLGIDPAKANFALCLLGPDGAVVAGPKELACSRAGFDTLASMLAEHVPAGASLTAGVEATATLDDNLLAFLGSLRQTMAVTLLRVDAAQTRHFSGAKPIRGKTDKSDARRIAQFTRTYAEELARFMDDKLLQAMHQLINERLTLAEDLAAEKNRLQDRLVPSFPEFATVFKDPCHVTALAVLDAAPTAAHAVRKRVGTLATIRGAKGCHVVGEERAQALLDAAKTSIASATEERHANAIRRIVARLRLLQQQIEETEAELEAFAQQTDETTARDITRVRTIPGIDLVSGCALVLRSSGLQRFTSAKALAAQTGACPDRKQTGTSSNTARLTHRGDRRLRATLYMSAMTFSTHDPAMAFHKWRFIQNKKERKQAICAVMNRMVRIAWTLCHTQQDYEPLKAIANCEKQHPALWKTFVKEHPAMETKVAKLHKNATKNTAKTP